MVKEEIKLEFEVVKRIFDEEGKGGFLEKRGSHVMRFLNKTIKEEEIIKGKNTALELLRKAVWKINNESDFDYFKGAYWGAIGYYRRELIDKK